MSAHTPGPWVHHPKDNIITTHDGRVTFEWQARSNHALSGKMSIEERDANARLIAAAPALLEALEDMFNGWLYIRRVHGDLYGVGWDRAEDKARAAIANAKGEA